MNDDIYFILICSNTDKKYYLIRTSYISEFKQINKYKHNKTYELIVFGSTYIERVCRLTVISSLRANGYRYNKNLFNEFLIHTKPEPFNRYLNTH